MVASNLTKLPLGDHTDPAVPGLQLRVRPKADGYSRTWLARYRWHGEWVRIVIGRLPQMSLAAARERALEVRRSLDNGIDPRRARPRHRDLEAARQPSPATQTGHSIEHLAAEFMARYVKPHRKQPGYVQAILDRDVLPEWRGRDARTIRPREVIELLDGIVDRGAPVLANRTAAVLSQMFRFGLHRNIVDDSPVKLLMRPGGKEKPRKRILTDAELQAFLRDPLACTRYRRLAHIVHILLLTGARRGELANAQWSEVDFDAKTWTIPDRNSKTGVGHVVPLTDWAAEQFVELKREAKGSRWILPTPSRERPVVPKQMTRSLAKCLSRFKKSGIAKFTLHDLRRTCRTGLSRVGVDPHIGERVLNHAQPGITAVYDRYEYLNEKRAALHKWAEFLAKLRDTNDGET